LEVITMILDLLGYILLPALGLALYHMGYEAGRQAARDDYDDWADAVPVVRCGGWMSEWISVKERLPEDDVSVLAVVYGFPKAGIELRGAYQFAMYVAADGWIIGEYPAWEDANVTHWMPLPEPPAEG